MHKERFYLRNIPFQTGASQLGDCSSLHLCYHLVTEEIKLHYLRAMQQIKPTEIRRYLINESDKRMKQLGFNVYSQKELKGFYDFRLTDSCTGIVMIDQYIHCGSLHFSVNVGTQIAEVVKIVNKFLPLLDKESRLRRNHESTIAVHLGYTTSTPTHQTYIPGTTRHVVSDLDGAIELLIQFGVPYMEKINTVESIYSSIDIHLRNISWKSLPVIYMLMNEKEKSLNAIHQSLINVPDFDVNKQQKLEYGNRLIEYIGNQLP